MYLHVVVVTSNASYVHHVILRFIYCPSGVAKLLNTVLLEPKIPASFKDICNPGASCDKCVVSDKCGFCRSKLLSGDGTASVIVNECRAGTQAGPSELAQPCDSWSFLSCEIVIVI